jgi:hypothetical protein
MIKCSKFNTDKHLWKSSVIIYVQNLNTILSKTRTGPVDPMIVSGWPPNKWYEIPHIAPLTRLSMAA